MVVSRSAHLAVIFTILLSNVTATGCSSGLPSSTKPGEKALTATEQALFDEAVRQTKLAFENYQAQAGHPFARNLAFSFPPLAEISTKLANEVERRMELIRNGKEYEALETLPPLHTSFHTEGTRGLDKFGSEVRHALRYEEGTLRWGTKANLSCMERFVRRARTTRPRSPHQSLRPPHQPRRAPYLAQWELIFEGLAALSGCRENRKGQEARNLRSMIEGTTPAGFLVPVVYDGILSGEFFVKMRALPAYPIQISTLFLPDAGKFNPPHGFAGHDLFHAYKMAQADRFWVVQDHSHGGLVRDDFDMAKLKHGSWATSTSFNQAENEIVVLRKEHPWIDASAFAALLDLRVHTFTAALEGLGYDNFTPELRSDLDTFFHEGNPATLCIRVNANRCREQQARDVAFAFAPMRRRANFFLYPSNKANLKVAVAQTSESIDENWPSLLANQEGKALFSLP